MYKTLIAGYGVFGSNLVNYITENHKNITITAIIEPNRHKRDIIKKLNINTYETILDVPKDILENSNCVVDCSPRGQGVINKKIYDELKLRSIFQNGEEKIGTKNIFYPGITKNKKQSIKIPLCSGIAILKILEALKNEGIKLPAYVNATHSKVTNTARMLTLSYEDSIKEVEHLFGVDANMDVIYLRGEPYNGNFMYYGSISLEYGRNAPEVNCIYRALNKHNYIEYISEDTDLLINDLNKSTKTMIVKESLRKKGSKILMVAMSDTPYVNFPLVVEAIKYQSNIV